jgi:hypothetical protein
MLHQQVRRYQGVLQVELITMLMEHQTTQRIEQHIQHLFLQGKIKIAQSRLDSQQNT